MGIKFRCPNGHKLNVKTFLAGKRGVCPDCGSTFRIPSEETGDSNIRATALESRKAGQAADVVVEADLAGPAVAVAEAAAIRTAAIPAAAIAASAGPVSFPVAQIAAPAPIWPVAPAGTGIPLPVPTALPAALPVPIVLPSPLPNQLPSPWPAAAPLPPVPAGVGVAQDPIAEAPAAIWYIRPPTGGQYGPARGDIMRKWIAEGRVSSDSLVWREGWTDWRSAGQLFPSLGSAGGLPAIKPVATPAPAAPTKATRPADRYAAKKKSSNELAIAALVCLVLVCLILVTVLVVVLAKTST